MRCIITRRFAIGVGEVGAVTRDFIVGPADNLAEKGEGLIFDIDPTSFLCGFVIRHSGQLYAYKNACPHLGTELDWTEGRFLDSESKYIICSTHGAKFLVENGLCIEGPCVGQSLQSLPCRIEQDNILVSID